MRNIRLRARQKIADVGEGFLQTKAIRQLVRHELLTIAHGNNTRIRSRSDLRCMLIGNLAATDNRDLKHEPSP
jgi:hypothetical protein